MCTVTCKMILSDDVQNGNKKRDNINSSNSVGRTGSEASHRQRKIMAFYLRKESSACQAADSGPNDLFEEQNFNENKEIWQGEEKKVKKWLGN